MRLAAAVRAAATADARQRQTRRLHQQLGVDAGAVTPAQLVAAAALRLALGDACASAAEALASAEAARAGALADARASRERARLAGDRLRADLANRHQEVEGREHQQ